MGFIMADADRELTFSSFITINHTQTIHSRVSESGKVHWEDDTQAEERERSGRRDQKREREGQTVGVEK